MPDIDPQLRNRNAHGAAAPSGGRTDVRSEENRGDAAASGPRRSRRGAELAVRVLWLVLGIAIGFAGGMIWAASVLSVN